MGPSLGRSVARDVSVGVGMDVSGYSTEPRMSTGSRTTNPRVLGGSVSRRRPRRARGRAARRRRRRGLPRRTDHSGRSPTTGKRRARSRPAGPHAAPSASVRLASAEVDVTGVDRAPVDPAASGERDGVKAAGIQLREQRPRLRCVDDRTRRWGGARGGGGVGPPRLADKSWRSACQTRAAAATSWR